METIQNFIGGKHQNALSGKTLPNEDPSTGTVYSTVPDSDSEDVALAVEAAELAFPQWSQTPGIERAKIFRRIADILTAKHEELARAESIDNGKPVSLARSVDIPRSIKNFSFFADTISQAASEAYYSDEPRAMHWTTRSPLGVVGTISPWNLPLYVFTWKIAPALITGNTVVAKPSEVTPMTAHLLSFIVKEAGLPPGVLNLVHGTGLSAGAALTAHPKIKAISFTGSTKTGAAIAASTATQFKKLSLEMGGKNPTVVFASVASASATFEKAVTGALRAAFNNQGEICLCGSRIIVEKSIYPKFREALLEKVKALKVGDPLLEDTNQGALVSRAHFEKVSAAIDLARSEGGKILCGGQPATVPGRCAKGYFYQPTLIEGLDPSCRTNQEEIFGPAATLIPFETEEEAIKIANGTAYGLSSSVWTTDISQAHRVATALEAGLVWINCWMVRDLRTPFGGVKQSGVGREGGVEALHFFTEAKSICISY
ncbi:aldehyde dehydrogenase [bacterium]|nr:aldehyde dehydrogenase [bacterium]